MQIIEVTNVKLEREFIRVNSLLFKNDPNYIQPLRCDLEEVFDSKKNKLLSSGKIKRWVLVDERGNLSGRIAAFYNPAYKNKGDTMKVGGCGFFDCINDQASANLLFDTARQWLTSMGIEAMDGPINFGERNKWWGLLVEGFHPPLYGMNYNPPYYLELFINYGFKVFYNQLCWHLRVDAQLPERFYEAHKKYVDHPDIHSECIQLKNFDKYALDFSIVYNKAWKQHEGNKQLSFEQTRRLFHKFKPILDPDIVWFTYYKDEPIALWLNLPDLNECMRHFKGHFSLLQKLRLKWFSMRGHYRRFVGMAYGIVPEWQGSGIDYYMIVEAAKTIQTKKKYAELELQWQGDFNPKMLSISKHLGCTLKRKFATFRYLFDRQQEFYRHPII
jgi:hypothetical protein